jgi:hypothetical protein
VECHFLGFTLYWGRSRKRNWVVKKRTARSRWGRTLKRISQWCAEHRHWPVAEQQRRLASKLRGHCAYFGVTGNYAALRAVYRRVIATWHYWLNRRAQRRDLSWSRFWRILDRHPLPRPRVVHSTHITS